MPSRADRRVRAAAYLIFFASFALVLILLHAPLLRLPFFWDELGYFVPAALDLYREGAWVPHSTAPNVHPPGLMACLAVVWRLAGYSIPVTRLAMLLMASAAVLAAFLLAIELCRPLEGAPAFSAVALLLVSPLFFTQAMMVQLDLPAMLFTALALLLFLQDRIPASALVCTAFVLFKETGVVAPLVLGGWLCREKRWREAAWFLAPLVALGGWLAVLTRSSGHILGSRQFAEYNFFYPLHPVRLAAALLRRAWFLFIDNFHWVGTVAIVLAWRRERLFANRPWKIAGLLAATHVLAVSVLGGAVLERYLLPVLPILYAAFAAAWAALSAGARRLSLAILIVGLIASNFRNPQYWPFPYENSLALVDFVDLQSAAAEYLERTQSGKTIFTAWPLTDALRRPGCGYVRRALPVQDVTDFRPSVVRQLDPAAVDVFVLYSRDWDPPLNLLRVPAIQRFRELYFNYEPQITGGEIQQRFGLASVARWTRRGQWIEVFARAEPK